tara:strand:- start:4847 stop:5002 length:156 start_codon:yes stop_codon:yes gene_type:complete
MLRKLEPGRDGFVTKSQFLVGRVSLAWLKGFSPVPYGGPAAGKRRQTVARR